METLRDMTAIDEWFAKPIFLAHHKWMGAPVKWAQKESTLDEAEQVILLRHTAIFCLQNNIAQMEDSMVGPQYPLEAIRHVHDILFGRHRRPGRSKQEKRIELQSGGRAHLPAFCTYPPPPTPQNPSEYPELNKEVKLPKRAKYTHIDSWMKTYSRIPADRSDMIRAEAEAYCFRFHVVFKGPRFIPTVLQHVHDSMYPPFWRAGRKKHARRLQYTYPGYGYTLCE